MESITTPITHLRFLCLIFYFLPLPIYAQVNQDLTRLQQAYPNFIKSVSNQYITWFDGVKMPVHEDRTHQSMQEKLSNPSLAEQIEGVCYVPGKPANLHTFRPTDDPGRTRYMPFFKKMYGDTSDEVRTKLTTIYWMPKSFGNKYPLHVTTVNGVNKHLKRVSTELDKLVIIHPEFKKFLANPGGTFQWRKVAATNYLSPHSFGIAMDINENASNYWQYDLQDKHLPVNENTPVDYHNNIPWEIVLIFEKNGFIWGGKWQHYDTMHFEYRPELLINHHLSGADCGGPKV